MPRGIPNSRPQFDRWEGVRNAMKELDPDVLAGMTCKEFVKQTKQKVTFGKFGKLRREVQGKNSSLDVLSGDNIIEKMKIVSRIAKRVGGLGQLKGVIEILEMGKNL